MNPDYLLLSGGGFDSMSLLITQQGIGGVLGIDYGQKAARGEQMASLYFSRKYKIPYFHIETTNLSLLFNHPILRGGFANAVIGGKWQDNFEGDRLEGRNLLLLSNAVMFAYGKGFGGIMTGFHKESSDKYPDAGPDFYHAFILAASKATAQPTLNFAAPFQTASMTRVDVLHAGMMKDPEVWYAYTCYGTPKSLHASPLYTVPCQRCVHCYKRKEVREQLIARGVDPKQLQMGMVGHEDHANISA